MTGAARVATKAAVLYDVKKRPIHIVPPPQAPSHFWGSFFPGNCAALLDHGLQATDTWERRDGGSCRRRRGDGVFTICAFVMSEDGHVPRQKRPRDGGCDMQEEGGEGGGEEKVLALQALFQAKAEEHEFDCPVKDCDGKLTINADLCRFGHGVIARCCAPNKSHKCKWCHVSYSFVPAEMWGEHLSYCPGNHARECICVDASQLQPRLTACRADGASESDTDEGLGPDCDKVAEKGLTGKRKHGQGFHDDAVLQAQAEEGFDGRIIGLVGRELKKHRKSILCGDEEYAQWWAQKLRELQRETVIR